MGFPGVGTKPAVSPKTAEAIKDLNTISLLIETPLVGGPVSRLGHERDSAGQRELRFHHRCDPPAYLNGVVRENLIDWFRGAGIDGSECDRELFVSGRSDWFSNDARAD